MSSLNKAQIIGNLGQDPEVRSTSSGTKVATLSVATNCSWTDRNGNENTTTEWHRVVLWEGLAEVAEEYLSKSDRIYVEGRIQYREWEDDEGRTRYTSEIVARRLLMLGYPKGRRARPEDNRRPKSGPDGGDQGDSFSEEALLGTDDDLPF